MMRWVVPLILVTGCTEYGVKPGLPFSSGGADTGAEPSEDKTDPGEDDTDPPGDDTDDGDDDEFRPSDFSPGWYILDEGDRITTNTNPSHWVSEHGDVDSFWYEPSGHHGLIDSSDPAEDFEAMRDYILERVPEPAMGIGNLHYYADSTIESFDQATFTYVMADFFVAPSEDPSAYRLTVSAVDDGLEVIVNSSILGFLKLDEGGSEWELGPYIRPGERNTLIVLLVDNDERNKFIQDMAFFRGDIMINGTP